MRPKQFMTTAYGFTLVEIMVTLIIVAIVLTLGVSTLSGQARRSKLTKSIQNIHMLVQKAQSEAARTSQWTCLQFSGTAATITLDNSGNHGEENACGDSTDVVTTTSPSALRSPVTFANCPTNITQSCVLWFDPAGNPQLCPHSGNCGVTSPPVCIPWDYQIVLSSRELDSSARAREIEISRAGIIHLPKLGEKGLITTLWAKTPLDTSGEGPCE